MEVSLGAGSGSHHSSGKFKDIPPGERGTRSLLVCRRRTPKCRPAEGKGGPPPCPPEQFVPKPRVSSQPSGPKKICASLASSPPLFLRSLLLSRRSSVSLRLSLPRAQPCAVGTTSELVINPASALLRGVNDPSPLPLLLSLPDPAVPPQLSPVSRGPGLFLASSLHPDDRQHFLRQGLSFCVWI